MAGKTAKASRSKSKSSKGKTLKTAAVARKGSSKKSVARSSVSGKFVSSKKTGRVVKASPAMSRLGKERIKTAVKSVVYRDAGTGKFSD